MMQSKKGFMLLEFIIALGIGLVTISLFMYSMYRVIPAYDALLFEGRFLVEDCCMVEQVSDFLLLVQSVNGSVCLATQEQGVIWHCRDGLDRCLKKRGNKLYVIYGTYTLVSQRWTAIHSKIVGVCRSFIIENNVVNRSGFLDLTLCGKSKRMFLFFIKK